MAKFDEIKKLLSAANELALNDKLEEAKKLFINPEKFMVEQNLQCDLELHGDLDVKPIQNEVTQRDRLMLFALEFYSCLEKKDKAGSWILGATAAVAACRPKYAGTMFLDAGAGNYRLTDNDAALFVGYEKNGAVGQAISTKLASRICSLEKISSSSPLARDLRRVYVWFFTNTFSCK